MNKTNSIDKTRQWLENMVIGLHLCPFAKKPYQTDKIRYIVLESNDLEQLTLLLINELQFLQKTPANEVETTLLILENVLADFQEFWDYTGLMENMLADLKYEGIFQLASFHPQYQFAGTAADAAENYTNRSPYPIIHILREASITKALENYPNPETIPVRNIALLEGMNPADLASKIK